MGRNAQRGGDVVDDFDRTYAAAFGRIDVHLSHALLVIATGGHQADVVQVRPSQHPFARQRMLRRTPQHPWAVKHWRRQHMGCTTAVRPHSQINVSRRDALDKGVHGRVPDTDDDLGSVFCELGNRFGQDGPSQNQGRGHPHQAGGAVPDVSGGRFGLPYVMQHRLDHAQEFSPRTGEVDSTRMTEIGRAHV